MAVMPAMKLRRIAVALAAALTGAAVFEALGVPAGALVGSTLAVTLIAALNLHPAVPDGLRDVGFATIGATLGAGVTPDILSDIARFPASIAALTLTVALVMLSSSWVLRRVFATSPPTALLGTSPGALSYAIGLAVASGDTRTDVPAVMTLQSLRLLLITLVLPPLIALIDAGAGATAGPHVPQELALLPSLVLIALCLGAGRLMDRFKVPAALLLSGILVSGIGHFLGTVEGRPSSTFTFFGFALAGAVIGARFANISKRELSRMTVAGFAVTGIAAGLSGAVSWVMARLLGLPFGQVWVSYAPGGVEGMSAMALTLDYDPVFVATHHIYRLLLLIAVLPFLVRLVTRAAPAKAATGGE